MNTLAHDADYSFTVYVRGPSTRPDKGYMSAYINWPSGGGRDLPDGPPTAETLDEIMARMRAIFLGEDEYITP